MSTNCLVTKLKSTVDNSNLEILGAVDLVVLPQSSNGFVSMQTATDTTADVEVFDNTIESVTSGNVKKDDTHCQVGSASMGGFKLYAKKATRVRVFNKYVLKKLGAGTNSVNDVIGGYSRLKNCNINDIYITLSEDLDVSAFTGLNLDSLTSFMLAGEDTSYTVQLTGDIKPFIDGAVNMTSFGLTNLNTTGMKKYNIADLFGNKTKITTLRITSNAFLTGTVEAFVAAQRAAGRTTNTEGIAISSNLGTYVTFNGSYIPSGTGNVSWTASTITVGNTTIDA